MNNLEQGLKSMSRGGGSIFLGILGLMMCFDLGGPINKSAYLFATAGLAAETTTTNHGGGHGCWCWPSRWPPRLARASASGGREKQRAREAWARSSPRGDSLPPRPPARIIPATMASGAVHRALTMEMHGGSAPHRGSAVPRDRRIHRIRPGDRRISKTGGPCHPLLR